MARDARQEQMPAEMCPSYFFSQWEIFSIFTDSRFAWTSFSTGMTCMPMPSPPGGTMGVMCSSGRNVIRSNIFVTGGFFSILSREELNSSALPGTK